MSLLKCVTFKIIMFFQVYYILFLTHTKKAQLSGILLWGQNDLQHIVDNINFIFYSYFEKISKLKS